MHEICYIMEKTMTKQVPKYVSEKFIFPNTSNIQVISGDLDMITFFSKTKWEALKFKRTLSTKELPQVLNGLSPKTKQASFSLAIIF